MNTVFVVFHAGKILCAFPEKDECKTYMKQNHPEIDGFDVDIRMKYLTNTNPNPGYFER